MTLPATVRQAAEDALSARFGGRVHIAAEVQFWPSCVFRCQLLPSSRSTAPEAVPEAVPETVIVRVPREGTTRSGRTGLHNEQAALEYLTEIGIPLAPRFLAGGGAAGFLVTEDLGTHPSLLDLLLGEDAEAARRGILAFAHGLGRLHAQTAGWTESLPAALPVVRVPVAEHWQQTRDAVAQLGLPTPQGADGDVEALARLLAEPGDCLALSSGDPSVVNCQISSGSVRFFDFEAACFRHALADAAVLRYLYPTGGPPWRLPHEVALQIEAAYRAELVQVCPIAQDDSRYERGMAAASAAWMILRMARLPRVDAGPDRDPWLLLPPGWSAPVPTRSRRRQLVAILETGIASARRACAFEALAAWCECLTDALRGRWPEAAERLPLYPAFSKGAPS
jgi:Ser/Thr protein kinase RdoA (MazF antagonist)